MTFVLDLFSNPGFTAILGVVLGQVVGWSLGRLSRTSDRDKELLAATLAAFDEQSRRLSLALIETRVKDRDGLQRGEDRFMVALGQAEMGVSRRKLKALGHLRAALLSAGGAVAVGPEHTSIGERLRHATDLRVARDSFLHDIRGIKPEPVPDIPKELQELLDASPGEGRGPNAAQ